MAEQNQKKIYPEFIQGLPEADIPFAGVKGWLAQGTNHQAVFFEIEPVGRVKEHIHGDQWGIVIEGELILTIDGNTRIYRKGDSYFIPGGVVHSAEFKIKTWVLDFFADKDRYKAKKKF